MFNYIFRRCPVTVFVSCIICQLQHGESIDEMLTDESANITHKDRNKMLHDQDIMGIWQTDQHSSVK